MLRAALDISIKELYGYMSNITGTIRQKELVADLSIMQHSYNNATEEDKLKPILTSYYKIQDVITRSYPIS